MDPVTGVQATFRMFRHREDVSKGETWRDLLADVRGLGPGGFTHFRRKWGVEILSRENFTQHAMKTEVKVCWSHVQSLASQKLAFRHYCRISIFPTE